LPAIALILPILWPRSLSGLDIGHDRRQRRAAQNPNYRKNADRRRDRRNGPLGQKTGAGWFRYEKGDRTATLKSPA
jgi:3-hydroxyacyl-CoA dehydrogenase